MTDAWTPDSWRRKPIKQEVSYPVLDYVNDIETCLRGYPPLVFAGEVRALENDLAKVQRGEAFLLQGGDCAESFIEHSADNIRDFFRCFLQMSLVLLFASSKPIVKIGRIAGQFAKPRSSNIEECQGLILPSYRGDIINDIRFTKEAREPDPQRMLMVYRQSAATLNLLRAFIQGGYASLDNVHDLVLDFIEKSPKSHNYKTLCYHITEAMAFMKAIGISANNHAEIRETSFYTSHEALLLGYEEAMTRKDSISNHWYDTSGHMVWIGDRTRQIDHAHVEFCRGIKNPIGLKCGPSLKGEDLLQLVDRLNPENKEGRLILITRFGYDKVEEFLPPLIETIEREGRKVIWSCDPMHGNTLTKNGYKTRAFHHILKEVEKFFTIHHQYGTYPGGIHIEMTGKNVTECIGGAYDISVDNLSESYDTLCDPRLNADQAIELAFLTAELIKAQKKE